MKGFKKITILIQISNEDDPNDCTTEFFSQSSSCLEVFPMKWVSLKLPLADRYGGVVTENFGIVEWNGLLLSQAGKYLLKTKASNL